MLESCGFFAEVLRNDEGTIFNKHSHVWCRYFVYEFFKDCKQYSCN